MSSVEHPSSKVVASGRGELGRQDRHPVLVPEQGHRRTPSSMPWSSRPAGTRWRRPGGTGAGGATSARAPAGRASRPRRREGSPPFPCGPPCSSRLSFPRRAGRKREAGQEGLVEQRPEGRREVERRIFGECRVGGDLQRQATAERGPERERRGVEATQSDGIVPGGGSPARRSPRRGRRRRRDRPRAGSRARCGRSARATGATTRTARARRRGCPTSSAGTAASVSGAIAGTSSAWSARLMAHSRRATSARYGWPAHGGKAERKSAKLSPYSKRHGPAGGYARM